MENQLMKAFRGHIARIVIIAENFTEIWVEPVQFLFMESGMPQTSARRANPVRVFSARAQMLVVKSSCMGFKRASHEIDLLSNLPDMFWFERASFQEAGCRVTPGPLYPADLEPTPPSPRHEFPPWEESVVSRNKTVMPFAVWSGWNDVGACCMLGREGKPAGVESEKEPA